MKWNNYILSSLVQVGSILGYGSSAFLLTLMKRKTQYISAAIMMAITQVILGFALIADVSTLEQLLFLPFSCVFKNHILHKKSFNFHKHASFD